MISIACFYFLYHSEWFDNLMTVLWSQSGDTQHMLWPCEWKHRLVHCSSLLAAFSHLLNNEQAWSCCCSGTPTVPLLPTIPTAPHGSHEHWDKMKSLTKKGREMEFRYASPGLCWSTLWCRTAKLQSFIIIQRSRELPGDQAELGKGGYNYCA